MVFVDASLVLFAGLDDNSEALRSIIERAMNATSKQQFYGLSLRCLRLVCMVYRIA